MATHEPGDSDEDEPVPIDEAKPIPTDDALRRLADPEFVAFVIDFWSERGWDVTEERSLGSRNVEAVLRQQWPQERTGLLHVHVGDRNVRRNQVREFVRTVQREDADIAYLVSATPIPKSVRETAAESGVVVVDRGELARLIDRSAAHGTLADRLSRPVAPVTEPFEVPWLLGRLNRALDRIPWSGKFERWLDRRIPTEPTTEDVAEATYIGFRLSYLVAAVGFVVLLAVQPGSFTALLVILGIVSVTYGGLLPAMAADIYVTRRLEATRWTPTWWSLASFVLYPIPLLVGGFYWYRRRERTRTGASADG